MPENYFDRLQRLLDLEAAAEQDKARLVLGKTLPAEAEASGYTLVGLVIRDEEDGLGGRVLLSLGKRDQNQPLPWARLGVGTPVLLSEEGILNRDGLPEVTWRGVVSRVQRETIQVAFETYPEAEAARASFRLDFSSDEIARRRQRQALQKVKAAVNNRLATLRDILLGEANPLFAPETGFIPFDQGLNASQLAAVRFALSAEDAAIIHGPPGTGKTTTIVELIRQIIAQGQTVLACAPSNLGVDNMLERLVAAGVNAIRLGHPARVLPELRLHTLDELVENHPDVRLAHRLARQAFALREQSHKYTRYKPERGERQAMRQEAKELLAEARKIEDQVVERLLDAAPVLCVTLTGLDSDILRSRRYDWCVMDEASQTTEPSAWIPLLITKKVVLAGDPCQLPPTVLSQEAVKEGFNISMMERLMEHIGPVLSRRLDIQYRMHEQIMAFSSGEFYEGSLVANASVRAHLLKDLQGVRENPLTSTPVDFIDTAGASYDEQEDPDGNSRYNLQEAELAVKKIQSLMDAGLSPEEMAVIAPYSAQVRLLRELLPIPGLEINSVDGFQGREKEAVIITLVRSNHEGEIGFLEDVRRMNVALTRARRKLVVIGDSATITAHPFYRRLVAYFESIGAYHSVWEE